MLHLFSDSAGRLGRPFAVAALSLVPILAAAPEAGAQTLTTVRVASGLSRPVYVTAPNGDYDRLFIVEQRSGTTGRIRVMNLRTRTVAPTPFLSVSPVATADEQGLLGLAFHPNYLQNGYFWIYYTAGDGSTVIERYRALGDPATATTADPASRQVVMTFSQPYNNHNGGWIGFGHDGYLYIASGDGGAFNDPHGNGQNKHSYLGKILRIDVDGPDNIPGTPDDDQYPNDPNKLYTIPSGNPYNGTPALGLQELWAYGLRNPWRCDIDPATGDLYIADVGQDQWEEINFQPYTGNLLPGQSGYQGNKNYGWRCYEGNAPFLTSGCPASSTMTFPFLVYGHTQVVPPTNATGCSITGGIVYRGCGIPELDGTYFFADYCSNRAFSLRYDGTTITDFRERTAELRSINPAYSGPVSFGRDARGEMYICSLFNGSVYQVVADSPYYDLNGDFVPDACTCSADWDSSGTINSNDISAFLNSWLQAVSNGTLGGDFDRSGAVNSNDISAFLSAWLDQISGC